MRHIIESGTDAASLAIFDPGSLPDDFEIRIQDDPPGTFEVLQQQGKALLLETGADGGYLLHAYVDEPIPPSLQQYAKEPIVVDPFFVTTGRVYFTGAEYSFRTDDSFLRKYPHMGGSFEIDPGAYSMTLYRTEYPEELMEDHLRKRVSRRAFQLHQNMGCYVGLAVVAFLALAGSFAVLAWQTWVAYVLPPFALILCLPFIVARTKSYRDTDRIWNEIQREYPSILATLERKNGKSPPFHTSS